MRVLELFCGIGGCAAALPAGARVVAAVDIDRRALAVYESNFPYPVFARAIESLSDGWFREYDADLWWLSPPCQPYTCRGRRRDVDDPRAASLLSLIDRIRTLKPPRLALENVPGFKNSRAHRRLRDALAAAGYWTHDGLLCPTLWGGRSRRRRYYLVASRLGKPRAWQLPPPPNHRLPDLIERTPRPELQVDAELCERYRGALHLVDISDAEAVTSCFTAAYGRSIVRSGSYLSSAVGIRRFSPVEILRLLGFPSCFELPAGMALRIGWSLAGNSVSVPAVRTVLDSVG